MHTMFVIVQRVIAVKACHECLHEQHESHTCHEYENR